MENKLNVIIMAGGLGKRMESEIPKVLHKVLDKPMIIHVIEESIKLSPKKILVVVGKYRDIIEKTIYKYFDNLVLPIVFIYQKESLGTGHAIQCCIEELQKEYIETTLILSGDVPLLKTETMTEIIKNINNVKIVTTELENPTGYGRIVEINSIFEKIIEEKDASIEQKQIKKINCGIYALNTAILCKYLPYLSNNNSQKEYYLTDIIEIIKLHEHSIVDLYDIPKDKQYEIIGINTKEQLIELEKMIKVGI